MNSYEYSCRIIGKIRNALNVTRIGINEAREQLQHEIPYHYIGQSEKILEIITNLSIGEYYQQLNTLQDLIYELYLNSSIEDVKRSYNEYYLEGAYQGDEYLEKLVEGFNLETDDWKLYMYDFQVDKFKDGDFKCALIGYLFKSASSFKIILQGLKILEEWCDFFQYRTLKIISSSIQKSYKNKFLKEYIFRNTGYCLYALTLLQKDKLLRMLLGLIDDKEDLYTLLIIVTKNYFPINSKRYFYIITELQDDELIDYFKKCYKEDKIISRSISDKVGVLSNQIKNSKEDIVKSIEGINNKGDKVRLDKQKKNFKNVYKISGGQKPQRRGCVVNRIVRKSNLVQALKELYDNTCQICECRLEVRKGVYYSEVHHIRPLGSVHQGSDTIDNTIVLCPNCHVLFDQGSIGIDEKDLKIIHFDKSSKLHRKQVLLKHTIGIDNFIYHNTRIYYLSHNVSENIKNSPESHKIIPNQIVERDEYVKNIDFKDEVVIEDIVSKEQIRIKIYSYWEQDLMPPIQKILLNKKVGDSVAYGEFIYSIKSIK